MQAPQEKVRAAYVLPETTLLAVLGGLDLLYTIYLLATHTAREANPLFSYILHEYGVIEFITMKAILLGAPLTIAEFARKKHPEFVRKALRLCLLLYVSIYVLSYLKYNLFAAAPPPVN